MIAWLFTIRRPESEGVREDVGRVVYPAHRLSDAAEAVQKGWRSYQIEEVQNVGPCYREAMS